MTTSRDQRYFVFDGFYLDSVERRLLGFDREPIFLSSRAFDVLQYLVQHPGDIVDKGSLMAAVWPNSIVEENNLNQAIAALRKALGEVAGEHRFIITIPGRGYRFVPEVRTSSSLPGSPAPAMPQPDGEKATTGSVTGSSGRSLWLGAVALVIVAVIALWAYRYLQSAPPEAIVEKSTHAVPPATPPAPEKSVNVVGAPLQSVAVLPFADLSPNKDQEYFADGVSEEILNQLSRIRDLFVVGRISSFSFKGRNEDLRVIGEKLGVSHILEGSVRKEGNRIRITAQLVNAADGYNLWSQSYDRDLNDIFAIQEDVAKSVADTLQITLGVGELWRVPGMTRDINAYDAYLAGRSLIYHTDRESIFRAIEHLEQAVTLDPDFALAWFALTDPYSVGGLLIPERAKEFLAKRDVARARVIALVPEEDYALRIKAALSGNRVAVERLFKQALARNPANYGTNIDYGRFLFAVGRPTEAVNYFQRAIRVEPLNYYPLLYLGLAYEFMGNLDAAAAAWKQGMKLTNQPMMFNGSLKLLALEQNDRARIDEYFTSTPTGANELNPIAEIPGARDINQVMYALLDTPAAAVAELRRFMTDPAYRDPLNRSILAAWASYYGEDELALRIFHEMSESVESVTGGPMSVVWRPIYRQMRRLPGFKDLVRKLGLVDYWRATGNWGEFCRPVGKNDFQCM